MKLTGVHVEKIGNCIYEDMETVLSVTSKALEVQTLAQVTKSVADSVISLHDSEDLNEASKISGELVDSMGNSRAKFKEEAEAIFKKFSEFIPKTYSGMKAAGASGARMMAHLYGLLMVMEGLTHRLFAELESGFNSLGNSIRHLGLYVVKNTSIKGLATKVSKLNNMKSLVASNFPGDLGKNPEQVFNVETHPIASAQRLETKDDILRDFIFPWRSSSQPMEPPSPLADAISAWQIAAEDSASLEVRDRRVPEGVAQGYLADLFPNYQMPALALRLKASRKITAKEEAWRYLLQRFGRTVINEFDGMLYNILTSKENLGLDVKKDPNTED